MVNPGMNQSGPDKALIAIAGFPKSGNTLINETLDQAGKLIDSDWVPPKYEYQSSKDLEPLKSGSYMANPYLGEHRCHIKTHIMYSDENYELERIGITIDSIAVIIRNPFDTLLSTTNYLRYSAKKNKRLTGSQISTLKHFYPDYSESDVLGGSEFNLEQLREKGALDQALEIFSASNTCIPQFLTRSGTWLDFYSSFDHTQKQTFKVRFEDIINSHANWEEASNLLATFLGCQPDILADAFMQQNESCQQARQSNNLFFPVAESKYFFRYFEGRSLRRFCNKYLTELKAFGYEDLIDEVMSH
jgi:hypothetical protein